MIAGCCGTREVWRGTGYDGQGERHGRRRARGRRSPGRCRRGCRRVRRRATGRERDQRGRRTQPAAETGAAGDVVRSRRPRPAARPSTSSRAGWCSRPIRTSSSTRRWPGPGSARTVRRRTTSTWSGGSGPVSVADVEVLHVCSLAPLLDPGADVVAELVERLAPTTTVSYDLNIRPAITGVGPEVVARVDRLVAQADLVKASDEDLAALWPDLDEDRRRSEHVRARGRQRGGDPRFRRGAWSWGRRYGGPACSSPPSRSTSSTPSVRATPSVQASSMRCGTTWAPGSPDLDPEARAAALTHAAACAAVTVSRAGADPPWRAEL